VAPLNLVISPAPPLPYLGHADSEEP
jgi:hypothetical protein